MSRRDSIHGDKDRHSPRTCAALRLEQRPDIILFRDCTLFLFIIALVFLNRTVPDFYIASLRCRTSNSRVAGRCATGDGCPHLTTEHGHSVSRRDSIHGDKDRHSPRTCAALRLEQRPDIILFRDCTLFLFIIALVFLNRTVPDFYIASLRCRTSNSRVAGRCATGDGCPHLTTEHGHPMPRRGFQSTGIKTVICPAPALLSGLNKCRTLSCSGIAQPFSFFSMFLFIVISDFI